MTPSSTKPFSLYSLYFTKLLVVVVSKSNIFCILSVLFLSVSRFFERHFGKEVYVTLPRSHSFYIFLFMANLFYAYSAAYVFQHFIYWMRERRDTLLWNRVFQQLRVESVLYRFEGIQTNWIWAILFLFARYDAI